MSTAHKRLAFAPEQLLPPTQAQIDECAARTAQALGIKSSFNTSTRVATSALSAQLAANTKSQPSVIEYTSDAGNKRIIQIVDEKFDPFSISRVKRVKQQRPVSPPSTNFVDPILAQASQHQFANLNIPIAVSTWKNTKAHVKDLGVLAGIEKEQRQTNMGQISDYHSLLQRSLNETRAQTQQEIIARQALIRQQAAIEKQQEQDLVTKRSQQIMSGSLFQMGGTTQALQPTKKEEEEQQQQFGIKTEDESYTTTQDTDDLFDLDKQQEHALAQQKHELFQKTVQHASAHNARVEKQQQQRVRDIGEVITVNRTGTVGAEDQSARDMTSNVMAHIQSELRVDDSAYKQAQRYNVTEVYDQDDVDQGRHLFEQQTQRNTSNLTSAGQFQLNTTGGATSFASTQDGLGANVLQRTDAIKFVKGDTISNTNNTQPDQSK